MVTNVHGHHTAKFYILLVYIHICRQRYTAIAHAHTRHIHGKRPNTEKNSKKLFCIQEMQQIFGIGLLDAATAVAVTFAAGCWYRIDIVCFTIVRSIYSTCYQMDLPLKIVVLFFAASFGLDFLLLSPHKCLYKYWADRLWRHFHSMYTSNITCAHTHTYTHARTPGSLVHFPNANGNKTVKKCH